MAINANLLQVNSIVRPTSTRTKKEKGENVIANRDWKAIPFVRESVDNEERGEMTAYLNAWRRSPAQLVIALLTAHWTVNDIAKKFGMTEKDPRIVAAVKDAQELLKSQIAHDMLDELPERLEYHVIDGDGVEQIKDVAPKLKKAVAAALFNGQKDTVTFSVVKNVPYHFEKDSEGNPKIPTLRDIFSLSSEQLDSKKTAARAAYAKVFRTRDTSAGTKHIALPPALAALEIELNAAESAE